MRMVVNRSIHPYRLSIPIYSINYLKNFFHIILS